MTEFPQLDSGLAVHVFNLVEDPIVLSTKQWNLYGRVIVIQVQGRQVQSYTGTGNKRNATCLGVNNAGGLTRVVKCYNWQGEGHMAWKCTQPKRLRNVAWFKEKAMLAEA
ncbi:retrovirus-related pol polyprotein from transposon TNT 1-94 [Tanacetum coccineum]